MYGRVNAVSRADDLLQRILVDDHYQCAGLVLRHSPACFCQVIDRLGTGQRTGLSLAGYPVEDGTSLSAVHVSVAESDQELSDFRLENHDQGQHSHVQHHIHYGGHEPHVEGGDQHPDHIQGNDRHEDAHGRRSSDPAEKKEYDEAEQKYVQDVSDGQLQKA